MANQSFPTIAVPHVLRPALNFKPLSSPPRCIEDLPSRLFMGTLIPETFKRTFDELQVEYRTSEFALELKVSDERFFVRETYRTQELIYYMGPMKMFGGPMCQFRMSPTKAMDNVLQQELVEKYNLQFIPYEKMGGVGVGSYFPDGFLMAFVIPIGITAGSFRRLSNFFSALPNDGSLSVQGVLEFAPHVINYRLGRCQDCPTNPMELYMWSLERGYIPLKLPEIEGPEGDQALTLQRMGYNLVLGVFMSDVMTVAEHLHQAGLLKSSQESPQEEPAVAAYFQALPFAENCAFFTGDRSRRIVFPKLLKEVNGLAAHAPNLDTFQSQLDEVLNRYEAIVERAQLAGLRS
ncbi:MAG: hypothetical protein FDZ69_04655 [Deltaproteobacteria bacterium]|nr:MAG: hypothetical protein FDZ69_04655 [Deltaproteobacteria bacterium]